MSAQSDQEIVALWTSGLTMTEIAARVGVSRERIRQRLKRNGISGTNRNSQLTAEEMLDAVQSRTAFAEVAESLGVSRGMLRLWLESARIETEFWARLDANKQSVKDTRDNAARARIVDIIIRTAAELGETPRASDLAPRGIYAVTLIRYFGSTPAAMQAAGLQPRKRAWGAGATDVTPDS